jgi:DNA-binding NtrC family response regulator
MHHLQWGGAYEDEHLRELFSTNCIYKADWNSRGPRFSMRILIADVQEGVDRLARVLSEEHSLVFAKSLSDAKKLVSHWDIDAIICGIQFDDSRMLELLSEIKSSGLNGHIPFICFRQASTEISASSEHATDLAACSLGACAYINASEITEVTDDELLLLIEAQLERDRPEREIRERKRRDKGS